MATLELLQRKIATAGDLQSVVATMKTLAAVSIHQYERAADALADYMRTIELGLQIVLREHREWNMPVVPDGNIAAVVFGSDQGMCGQFNELIASFAIEHHSSQHRRPPHATCVVGGRAQFALVDAGWPIDKAFRIPTSVQEIADCVSDLLTAIEQLRKERNITTIRVYSNVRSKARTYEPQARQLLPISSDWLHSLRTRKWESCSLPTYAADCDELMSLLIRQSLYVALYRACAESLASENASRIAAMQAAEKNIDETLEELNMSFKTQRQTDITEELLDVVIGFEALTSARKPAVGS